MAFLLLFSIIHGIHQSIGRKEDSALRICVCFDGEGDDRRIKRNESDELFPLVSFLCLCVCEMSQCRNHTKLGIQARRLPTIQLRLVVLCLCLT